MQPRWGQFIIPASQGIREAGRIPRFSSSGDAFCKPQRKQNKNKNSPIPPLLAPPPPLTSNPKSSCCLKQLMKEEIITNILHFSGGGTV